MTRFTGERKSLQRVSIIALATLLVACGTTAKQEDTAPTPQAVVPKTDPYPSTYRPAPGESTLIRGATVLIGNGERIDQGDVLIVNGRIETVGKNVSAPAGARVIDAQGRWVTPGLIDVHSHLGVYPSPSIDAHNDGNEMIDPVTPNAWAEHAVWPQDPGLQTALEGGVTTLQVLPGSGNLIGGRGVTLKNVAAATYQAMKFPGAPQGLKMACGENPKRFYGTQSKAPMTRMGNVAGYRQAFADAQHYRESLQKYQREVREYEKKKQKAKGDDEEAKPPEPPKRDLKSETLVAAMAGEIQVHVHCYRADEMATMLDLAEEFGFKIAAFHHAVEFYKLADRLAEAGEWADWWGFKMEAFDGIQENIALTDRPPNGCAIVHSDSEEGIQRGEGDDARHTRRSGDFAGACDSLGHVESSESARHRRAHRHVGNRQDG
jgi:imidazolonepropionase-like amidohydrolase